MQVSLKCQSDNSLALISAGLLTHICATQCVQIFSFEILSGLWNYNYSIYHTSMLNANRFKWLIPIMFPVIAITANSQFILFDLKVKLTWNFCLLIYFISYILIENIICIYIFNFHGAHLFVSVEACYVRPYSKRKVLETAEGRFRIPVVKVQWSLSITTT